MQHCIALRLFKDAVHFKKFTTVPMNAVDCDDIHFDYDY